jgi:tripartite-type tricarboxylate transporter receptor subunit TctC
MSANVVHRFAAILVRVLDRLPDWVYAECKLRAAGGPMRASQCVMSAIAIAMGVTLAALPDRASAQQKFPSKPVRIIVAAAAGGTSDTLARMIGQKLSEGWGQAVVVDNRPGAGGTLAAGTVAKAAPDGYTLFLTPSFAINAALQPNLPYDPLKDFAGVSHFGYGTQVLVAAPALSVKSVKDLIAIAQSQPGKIIYGSTSAGSGTHLSGIRFNVVAGIKVITVAFKGAPEAMIEVLAGRTHYSVLPLATSLPILKEGKLLALAALTPQRSPLMPDVPALAETLPEFKRPDTSLGLLAPAKTPRVILNQISKEIVRILALPEIKERLQSFGFAPAPSTPEEHDKILREQIATLTKLAKDAGLRAK